MNNSFAQDEQRLPATVKAFFSKPIVLQSAKEPALHCSVMKNKCVLQETVSLPANLRSLPHHGGGLACIPDSQPSHWAGKRESTSFDGVKPLASAAFSLPTAGSSFASQPADSSKSFVAPFLFENSSRRLLFEIHLPGPALARRSARHSGNSEPLSASAD